MSATAPGNRDPGALLRLARDRMTALTGQAPPELCPTPEDTAGLRNLLLWAFPIVYAQTPAQTSMRAEAGGCEFHIHPAQLRDDGCNHAMTFMDDADFRRAHLDGNERTLVPGETFGFAAVFCDAAGARLGSAVAVLPAGEGLHWPPPLSFLPGLDTACNVLYHIIDRTPVEVFGGTEQRDTFRGIVFERLLPFVYERYEPGGAFVITFSPAPHPDQLAQTSIRFMGPEHRDRHPLLFHGVQPGLDFALVFDFEGHGMSQYRLPCLPEWPTEWVTPWLRARPSSNACRRCATRGGRLKRCSSCMAVRYCSSTCQLADWRRHKAVCAILKCTREPSD